MRIVRKLSTKTIATFRCLLAKHSKLLQRHYPLPSATEDYWPALLQHGDDLHEIVIQCLAKRENTGAAYRYGETMKRLIVNHWQLWQTHCGEEPPVYLIAAIDAMERHFLAWFSYERGEWIEE